MSLAIAYNRDGFHRHALAAAEEARRQGGDLPEGLIVTCRDAIAREPASPDLVSSWLLNGRLALDGERPAAAWPWVGAACQAVPDREDAWLARGEVFAALRQGPEALASHEQALALNPESLPALGGKAYVLGAVGRNDKALQCYAGILERDPESEQDLVADPECEFCQGTGPAECGCEGTGLRPCDACQGTGISLEGLPATVKCPCAECHGEGTIIPSWMFDDPCRRR